ncbi:chemotaxis protein CheW [Clostridiaceae bacterium]|jgi:Chemotaxis signal transduction protein|nr:chemotaxis protein CheW [Lachnospiraceae bacterium]NBH18409.1 chemotaxis protein CheW [Clostridiaceae bacterium]NBH35739.1 chemotaxis protein CheW [Clostridiaceae bacterium]
MSEQMNDQEVLTVSNADENSAIERCLTFESGDLILYISTKHVIEIINNHSITTLPLVPPYIKGIINLRGQILPVVDLQQRMGKEDSDYTSKTCIIVLEIDSISLGIIVDSVRQVVDINLKHVRPIPIKRQQKLLDGMVIMEDGSVFMSVDCQALSSTED